MSLPKGYKLHDNPQHVFDSHIAWHLARFASRRAAGGAQMAASYFDRSKLPGSHHSMASTEQEMSHDEFEGVGTTALVENASGTGMSDDEV